MEIRETGKRGSFKKKRARNKHTRRREGGSTPLSPGQESTLKGRGGIGRAEERQMLNPLKEKIVEAGFPLALKTFAWRVQTVRPK